MSLADYRTDPGVNTENLVEPFAGRLLRLLDTCGGAVRISSGYRTNAEQWVLWNLNPDPWAVARPGTSNHEFGLAADLRIVGALTWPDVHKTAATCGLRFPLPNENWHCEADPAFVDPPEETDMTPQELAHALGGTLDGFGRVVIPLADGDLYPIGNVIGFVHSELTKDELFATRLKKVLES